MRSASAGGDAVVLGAQVGRAAECDWLFNFHNSVYQTTVPDLIQMLQDAAAPLATMVGSCRAGLRALSKVGALVDPAIFPNVVDAAALLAKVAVAAGQGLLALIHVPNSGYTRPASSQDQGPQDGRGGAPTRLDALVTNLEDVVTAIGGEDGAVRQAAKDSASAIENQFLRDYHKMFDQLEADLEDGASACLLVAAAARSIYDPLSQIQTLIEAGPPTLPHPRLAWEYFDGEEAGFAALRPE